MEPSVKHFESFAVEERVLAVLAEIRHRLNELELHQRARESLISELIEETDHPDIDLTEAIKRLGVENSNSLYRIDELVGAGRSALEKDKNLPAVGYGAAAHRALRLWMVKREAEKDPTEFHDTYERVSERYRWPRGVNTPKSLGEVVRAVAATGDPEAKQFLDDEPEQLGD